MVMLVGKVFRYRVFFLSHFNVDYFRNDHMRFFCFQVIEHYLKTGYKASTIADHNAIKTLLLGWLELQVNRSKGWSFFQKKSLWTLYQKTCDWLYFSVSVQIAIKILSETKQHRCLPLHVQSTTLSAGQRSSTICCRPCT